MWLDQKFAKLRLIKLCEKQQNWACKFPFLNCRQNLKINLARRSEIKISPAFQVEQIKVYTREDVLLCLTVRVTRAYY